MLSLPILRASLSLRYHLDGYKSRKLSGIVSTTGLKLGAIKYAQYADLPSFTFLIGAEKRFPELRFKRALKADYYFLTVQTLKSSVETIRHSMVRML